MRYRYLFCVLLVASLDTSGYEIQTHQALTDHATNQSVLGRDPQLLRNLGIESDLAQTRFPDLTGAPRTIPELLQIGSHDEDLVPRFTRHFYNPVTGKGMDAGTFRNQTPSPDWALAPVGSIASPIRQENSYWDARQSFFDALTTSSVTERERSFGTLFRSLGHVVHHLQDMAQPQHVRDDVHCGPPILGDLICGFAGLPHQPSFYEKWTNQDDVLGSILQRHTNPTSVGYDITGTAFTSVFNSPRRFWHTELLGSNSPQAGKGIAEFTNRNFVSAGTNFDKPQQPSPPFFALPAFDPTKKTERTVAELCNNTNLIPPCPPSMTALPQERITFYETTGHDNFLNVPFTNPRASSESIFDEQLRVQGEQPVFALNRFNFDEAYKHLIPRAVAYSAGMINYFFRGKIDIDSDPNNPGGYLIKNLGAEAMIGKFALYYDATDGLRKGVRDTDGNPVVWDSRVIFASAAGQISPGGGAMPVTGFATPDDAKTPGEYLLVFNGDMGEEKADEANGVVGAVASKFIPAPGANGVLYLLARNAFNRNVVLKVDKNSTVTATDFDPFGSAGSLSSVAHAFKQVAFKRAVGGGWSYQVLAGSFLNAGTNPGFYWDEASRKFISHPIRRWVAQSPDPAIGKFFFWLTQSNGQHLLNYTREFVDASGVKRTTSGTVAVPRSTETEFFFNLSDQIINGLPVSEDGLRVGDFIGERTTTGGVTEKKYYELLITLAEVPRVELNLLRTLRDSQSVTRTIGPNFSLQSFSSTGHSEDLHFIGYFNGSKEFLGVTIDSSASGSGEFTSSAPCFDGTEQSAFQNYQTSFVRTDQLREGSLVFTETCDNTNGIQRSGGLVSKAVSYRAVDAVYTIRTAEGAFLLNFRNVSMPFTGFIAESSPIGEVFFATQDLSVIIHEPRPGGIQRVVLPPGITSLLAAIWL